MARSREVETQRGSSHIGQSFRGAGHVLPGSRATGLQGYFVWASWWIVLVAGRGVATPPRYPPMRDLQVLPRPPGANGQPAQARERRLSSTSSLPARLRFRRDRSRQEPRTALSETCWLRTAWSCPEPWPATARQRGAVPRRRCGRGLRPGRVRRVGGRAQPPQLHATRHVSLLYARDCGFSCVAPKPAGTPTRMAPQPGWHPNPDGDRIRLDQVRR